MLVYVVGCRPFPEKVIGGVVEFKNKNLEVMSTLHTHGTFELDPECAQRLADKLNARDISDYGDCWKVYSAELTVDKEGFNNV